MNLLIISEGNHLKENFEPHFEEVEHRNLSSVRLNLLEDKEDVLVGEESVEDFDYMYINVKPELSIFVRVMLEGLEKNMRANLDSTSSYILTKKQYLYKVLKERNMDIPKTVAVGSEKSALGVKELEYPIVARRYQGFRKREMSLLSGRDGLKDFSKSTNYGKEALVFQEFVDGDVFDCLVIGDEVISVNLCNEGEWNLRAGSANEKFYNISSDLRELVINARESIGANVCRVKIVGDKIVNMSPNPDLKRFQDISGKNTFKKVADLLVGEE